MKEFSIEKRKEICMNCPIFNPDNYTCNSKLYLNPKTDEVSISKKPGFTRGCGCFLKMKWQGPFNHCIVNKW